MVHFFPQFRDFGETLLMAMVLAPLASSMEIQAKSADYARYIMDDVENTFQFYSGILECRMYSHIYVYNHRYSHPMASSKYRELAGLKLEPIYETWPDAILAKTVSLSVC